MIEAPLHPLDWEKLRRVGELLCDMSAGRVAQADAHRSLLWRTGELMMCVRGDCRTDGAEGVARRLAGLADWRFGSEGMMEAALTEILLGDAGGAIG
jgi:hypothetical protein